MEGYGWKDRTYESIPKAHKGSRTYWLAMNLLDKHHITTDEAERWARTIVDLEDNPQLELQA